VRKFDAVSFHEEIKKSLLKFDPNLKLGIIHAITHLNIYGTVKGQDFNFIIKIYNKSRMKKFVIEAIKAYSIADELIVEWEAKIAK